MVGVHACLCAVLTTNLLSTIIFGECLVWSRAAELVTNVSGLSVMAPYDDIVDLIMLDMLGCVSSL